jgi:hypothetical protein
MSEWCIRCGDQPATDREWPHCERCYQAVCNEVYEAECPDVDAIRPAHQAVTALLNGLCCDTYEALGVLGIVVNQMLQQVPDGKRVQIARSWRDQFVRIAADSDGQVLQ